MAIRTRITRECYDREAEDMKDEIRCKKAEEEKKRRETVDLLQSLTRLEDGKEPLPEEYARLVHCPFPVGTKSHLGVGTREQQQIWLSASLRLWLQERGGHGQFLVGARIQTNSTVLMEWYLTMLGPLRMA
jgi:hypothetical protein